MILRVRKSLVAALTVAWLAAEAMALPTPGLVPAGPKGKPEDLRVAAKANVTALPAGQPAAVAIVIDIPPGYHIQSNAPLDRNLIPLRVTVTSEPAAVVIVGLPLYPKGHIETYPALGRLSVHTGRAIVYVPVEAQARASVPQTKIQGTVSYQMCDDKQCLFPEETPFELTMPIAPPGQAVQPTNTELFRDYVPATGPVTAPTTAAAAATQPSGAQQGSAATWSVPLAMGLAFLAGLLFNIMPCVLPVLPLKAYGFYEVSQHNRGRSALLGLVFSAGIVAIFAILAVLILVSKTISWGEPFSNPWFVGAISLVLVVMALGMFGFFTVGLPTAVYQFTPRHDTLTGNFLFGGLTAILSTPCTAPLFPGLLIFAQAQPLYIGVPAMLMVGVGMAAPYLLLSLVPELARKLPRTGPWSELFKQMLGFILLAAAAWFAGGHWLSGNNFWWAIVIVTAIGSIYLMMRTVQLSASAVASAVSATIAVAMLGSTIYFAVMSSVEKVQWEPYSAERLAEARASGKIALVKFTANWCANCKYIEGTVYKDDAVAADLTDKRVITLKADLTQPSAPGKVLLTQLTGSGGIPLTAIWPPGSDKPILLSSIYSSGDLIRTIDAAAAQQ